MNSIEKAEACLRKELQKNHDCYIQEHNIEQESSKFCYSSGTLTHEMIIPITSKTHCLSCSQLKSNDGIGCDLDWKNGEYCEDWHISTHEAIRMEVSINRDKIVECHWKLNDAGKENFFACRAPKGYLKCMEGIDGLLRGQHG